MLLEEKKHPENIFFFQTNLRKAIIIMKFTLLFFFVSVWGAVASSYAQSTKLTLKVKNEPIAQVIKKIEQQSKYTFVYNVDEVDLDRKVSISAQGTSIKDVLNNIFAGQPIEFVIKERHVALYYKLQQKNTRKISGVISDKEGNPIIGANIVQKGTTNGIVSDLDGHFTLNVDPATVLVISYIGFMSKEIPVGDKTELSIILEEDSELLEEVVVVGYGTMQRKNFTGSVSTVNMDNSPVAISSRTNVMDALRGTVTGVNTSREMAAGSTPTIEVHGQKSIKSSSANPLIVLDGVIYMGGWRDLDPSTIESVSVLKDATSLAAYGSQAANGVIMVTTKKGKIGKPMINFDGSVSFSNMAQMPRYLSPEDFVNKTNIALDAANGNPQSWMKPSAYENYLTGKTTDWIDYVTQTGLLQKYAFSVSGATEKLNYYLSLSHTDQKGILIGDDYSREAIMIRLQNDITDWLQVGAQVNYTYNNYDGVSAKLQPYLSPFGQATRSNGQLEKYVMEEGVFAVNPLWDTSEGRTVDDLERYATTYLKGHVLLKCPWVKGLSYRFNGVYSMENYRHDRFNHEGYFVTEGAPTDEGRYSEETIASYLSNATGYNRLRANTYYVIDNILNYTAQFDKHFIDLTAVYTRDQYISDLRKLNGSNYDAVGNSILGYNGLAFAEVQTVEVEKTKKTNIGYLGRLNYNFDDRYHLSVSVRRDGSSVFGVDNKWGIFPAVGAAWTLSRERFMESVDFLNYLKLNASWGKNGNQSLGAYGTLSTINLGQTGDHPYLFGNAGKPSWGQYVAAIGNSELGWETTTAVNVGLDAHFLNDRIQMEMNGYKSKTTDQIFERMIPVMNNGFTKMKATMGQVNNWGIEFTLNTLNVRNKDFQWSSMLNFYLNRNKLVDLYGDGKDDLSNSLFIGKSLGAIYGYKVIGIIQEDDKEYIEANNAVPGDPKYANVNESEDGRITADDRTILGYRKENFRMNMSHTFTYKNFELYALFTGVFGGNGYGLESNPQAYLTNNSFINNLDHTWWTPENRNNTYPRPKFNGSNYTPVMGYTFIRLQDLNLSYTFKQTLIRNMGINNLRIYLAARNLFTITNWVGGDPEIRQRFEPLSATDTYPLQRSFSIGVNLSF